MTNDKKKYLSRSALAEKLSVTLKELTQTMIESGWIKQQGKEWLLTAKGEFEGGIYRESKKFGKYIAWPESVISHPAIAPVTEALLTSTALGKAYSLSGKTVNRLLASLGWVYAIAKGWQLTELGKAYGGKQQHSDQTGIPYVVWNRTLLNSPELEQYVQRYLGHSDNSKDVTIDSAPVIPATIVANSTLTAGDEKLEQYLSLNGCYIANNEELIIANWLYVQGLSYAYKRIVALPNGEAMVSDFYLPNENVHIHYNATDVEPSQLAAQLERQSVAKTYQLRRVELSHEDLTQLDNTLPKMLLQWDIVLL